MFSPIGIRLMVMMFLQFFIWGSWYITVGNYMQGLGWADDIAWAYTVGPIAGIISPFFLGMVADRFFSAQKVLGTLHILGGILMVAAPLTAAGENPSSTLFIACLLGHMLCYMPTLGLVNTVAFQSMTDQEKQFPIIRVFGTLGWIVAGFAVAYAIDLQGVTAQFHLTAIAAFALGIYSFTLPASPPPAKGQKVELKDILCLDALALMKDRSFLVFMLCSFLICIPLSAYYAYAPVFLDALEVAQDRIPIIMSYGQMSEVFFMVVMPAFFAFLGVKWMLAVGMFAWVARYALFAGSFSDSPQDHVLWMAVGGVLLHGICYDFFFVTGQIYVDKRAPLAIRGQAQGFLVLMTLGLGLLIGAQVAGWLVDQNTPPEARLLQDEAKELGEQIGTLKEQAEDIPEDSTSPADQDLLAQITGMEELQKARGHEANTLIAWDRVWLWPTGMAAVILAAFCVLFRYRRGDENISEDPPVPPPAAPGPADPV